MSTEREDITELRYFDSILSSVAIDGLRLVHVIHGKKDGSDSSQSFEAGKIVAFHGLITDTDAYKFIPPVQGIQGRVPFDSHTGRR